MKKISIRPITYDDTDLIVKWRNTKSVMARFIFQEKFTREIHENWMRTKVETGKVEQFIIELDGVPIGSEYLRDVDYDKKEAEFGIFIGEETNRGMGFGKKAIRLLLEYAFYELELNRIILRVFEDNTIAINSYKGIGFTQYEYKHDILQNGVVHPMILMDITKQYWEEQKK